MTTHTNTTLPDLDGLEDPDAYEADHTLSQTEEIQEELISIIMKDLGVLHYASKHLKPNCFQLRTHKLLAEIAFQHYDQHKQVPPKSILTQELLRRVKDDKDKTFHLAKLECAYEYIEAGVETYSWYKEQIRQFAKRSAAMTAVSKFLSDSHQGNLDLGVLIEGLSAVQKSLGENENKTFALGERSATTRPEWLVHSLLRKNTIGTLFGESGCRKTWLAIDLALSVATGTPFLGRIKVKKGKVFYIISEGADDFEDRAAAWSRERSSDLPSIDQLAYYPGAYDFNDDTSVEACLGHIEERLGGTDLIVIDTLAKNFNGDADKNADMGKFLNQLERLRSETNATVLVLHHTGWGNTDRERGGRAIRDNVDTSILVEKDGDFSKMVCRKQKLGKEFADVLVRFETVRLPERDTEDEQVTALVGHLEDSQDGLTSNQLVDLLSGLFQLQDSYTQQDLVKALQGRWKGKPPGRDRMRELIAEQVEKTIFRQSESGKYVYRISPVHKST